ncbi:MAG: DUF4199 domain-containing protein [Bacteroidales bacterium]|nr:DUF4199 domain-containing protein [Bacteroidales bacterium]
MENQNYPSGKHSFTYGLVTGIILIFISLLLYILDFNPYEHKWSGFINYVALLAGIVISAIHYKVKHCGGYINYGKSLSVGFLTGLIASIIVGIYTYFFMRFLGDEIRQIALDQAEEKIYEQIADPTDEQINATIKITKFFLKSWMSAITAFVIYTFFSLIFALIASIFIKKEDKSLEANV